MDNNNPTIQPQGLSQVVPYHTHNGVDSPKISSASTSGVSSFNTRTGAVTLSSLDVTTALTFTPENVANKSTNTSLGTSDTLYPTQNAVKTYVDSHSSGSPSFTAGIDLAAGLAVYIAANGNIYPTDATSASYTTNFIGITTASISRGNTGSVYVDGVANGLSGLSTGIIYYLANATESSDQSQTGTHGGGAGNIINGGVTVTRWQSIVPGGGVTNITKVVVSLGISSAPNTTTLNFSIYSGTGIGGTLLGSVNQAVVFASSPQTVTAIFTNPIQTPNPYTLAISYVSGFGSGGGQQVLWLDDDANSYPAGTTDQGGVISYVFTTYDKTGLGQLSSSPGSTSKKVGIATSTTSLILKDSI